MGWLPAGASNSATDEGRRCGVQRASMRINGLLAKSEIGKVKKSTFANPSPDHVFGMPQHPDAEGAKEVTMIWKSHEPNPDDRPGPDFKAMNKMAASNGLTTSKQVRAFRDTHNMTLRSGTHNHGQAQLPSDVDPSFTYGKPASYRAAEEVRNCGPEDPPMKHLVQGAYAHEWVAMNQDRAAEFDVRRNYIKPSPTRATLGHAAAAATMRSSQDQAAEPFKMTKFKSVKPKVTQYITGNTCTVESIHN